MNPWLEKVELQEDAYPYHDWNEKITAECYMANCTSRLLNNRERIRALSNNFSRISFNFGPTLLSWLKLNDFKTYSSIIDADLESRNRFEGHGSAIAQVYNHVIMPLTSDFNKKIQTVWAIRDFELNFKRRPEGIWLAETAVDRRTLEILAENGLKFTILSPEQASRIRKINHFNKNNTDTPGVEDPWVDVSGGKINTGMPYLCRLPGRKEIAIFFYDYKLSNEVAFGDLLKDGENFAKSILQIPDTSPEAPGIIIIASDGETYGHHHRFGDMALAYCIDYLESKSAIKLAVLGQYLEKYKPVYEVEIIENSSWSCSHGISRWEDDCGCSTGDPDHTGWNQKWRKPLRQATGWLEDKIFQIYETRMKENTSAAGTGAESILEDYIYIINNRNQDSISHYLLPHLVRNDNENTVSALKLLEMYRQSLLMQSSDGWFFDDISRKEPVQIMMHASRAMELAKNFSDEDLEGEYKRYLKNAKSNAKGFNDGADIYERSVEPYVYDFNVITACHAVNRFLEHDREQVYCYSVKNIIEEKFDLEDIKIITGMVIITSGITLDSKKTAFALCYSRKNKAVYDDALVVFTSITGKNNEVDPSYVIKELERTVKNKTGGKIELHDSIKALLKKNFPDHMYSIKDLPKDYRLNITDEIISDRTSKSETIIGDTYESISSSIGQQEPEDLLFYLQNGTFKNRAVFYRELSLFNKIKKLVPDSTEISRLKKMIDDTGFHAVFNTESLNIISAKKLTDFLHIYREKPLDISLLQVILDLLEIFDKSGLNPNIYKSQNIVLEMKENLYGAARSGRDENLTVLIKKFEKLLDYMNIEHENT